MFQSCTSNLPKTDIVSQLVLSINLLKQEIFKDQTNTLHLITLSTQSKKKVDESIHQSFEKKKKTDFGPPLAFLSPVAHLKISGLSNKDIF